MNSELELSGLFTNSYFYVIINYRKTSSRGAYGHDPFLKTPADPKHEIDKSYTYGKLFFLWI